MKYLPSDWKAGKPLPKGWDVADAIDDGWTEQDILSFLRETLREWPFDLTPPPAPQPPPKPVKQEIHQDQAKPAESEVVHMATRTSYTGSAEGWQGQMIHGSNAEHKPSSPFNWFMMMVNHPDFAGMFSFDTFRQTVMVTKRPPWEDGDGFGDVDFTPRRLRDSDYTNSAYHLERLGFTPTSATIISSVHSVAERTSFDPLEGYLNSVKWDGHPRVDGFFTNYLGVREVEYAQIVSRRYLLSAVARALQPGCKVDTMPIIEGPQGLMKSTSLRALFGDEFFSDEISDISSKDAMIEMSGVWCIEIAEMHRMSNAETNAVKKFLSRQIDRYRPPYGRSVVEVPRRVVLAGTINPDGNPYLKDPTGARRFWPLRAAKIDIEAIRRDRDQIWAEAVSRFRGGEAYWIQADEQRIVEDEQAMRTDVDIWTDAVMRATEGQRRVRLTDILTQIGVPAKDANQLHAQRIGRIMARAGWKVERDGPQAAVVYRKKDEDPPPDW